MRLPAFLSLLVLALQEAEAASLPMERKQRGAETAAQGGLPAMLPLGDYNYSEILDLGNYEELTDYGDHQPPEVRDSRPCALQDTGRRSPSPSAALLCRCLKQPSVCL